MKKITIKDVAKEAGVSISTVSNALNNPKVIKPKTRARILKIVDELNYVPDLRGRNLKSTATKVIGFFTTNVSGPYFHDLVEYMAKESERNGYALNVFISKDKQTTMKHLLGGLFDGAIISLGAILKEKDVEFIQKQKIKTVFIDRKTQTTNTSSVLFNSYESSYQASSYLINMGHRDIVFIGGSEASYDSVQRKNGFINAMKDAKIALRDKQIITGFYEKSGGYNATKSYLRENERQIPDAFLAANDLSAMGSIEALKSEGIHVPEDVSVMGFDDVEIAKYYSPKLTTVANPISRQGVVSVQELIQLIKEEKKGEVHKLKGEIIVRDSTSVFS